MNRLTVSLGLEAGKLGTTLPRPLCPWVLGRVCIHPGRGDRGMECGQRWRPHFLQQVWFLRQPTDSSFHSQAPTSGQWGGCNPGRPLPQPLTMWELHSPTPGPPLVEKEPNGPWDPGASAPPAFSAVLKVPAPPHHTLVCWNSPGALCIPT